MYQIQNSLIKTVVKFDHISADIIIQIFRPGAIVRIEKGIVMINTEVLARNSRRYSDEIVLVGREPAKDLRREISWREFDRMANRVANALIARGIKKGDRVIHLMMNCLEWLPFYSGILRTGAWTVPLNFRFTAKDMQYCAEIADAKAIVFGEEFVDRVDSSKDKLEGIADYKERRDLGSKTTYFPALNKGVTN